MKKSQTTGKIIRKMPAGFEYIELATGECRKVKVDSSHYIGQLVNVYYDIIQIAHACRCFVCHGSGCYVCKYTGATATYTEKKINLTTRKL